MRSLCGEPDGFESSLSESVAAMISGGWIGRRSIE
jgi:hypothetical protein